MHVTLIILLHFTVGKCVTRSSLSNVNMILFHINGVCIVFPPDIKGKRYLLGHSNMKQNTSPFLGWDLKLFLPLPA